MYSTYNRTVVNHSTSLLRLFRARAELVQRALRALRLAGHADRAAVVDDAVGEAGPLLLREQLHQVRFDHDRIDTGGESQAAGHAGHVGIDHHAYRLLEGIRQHYVRRLAAPSW